VNERLPEIIGFLMNRLSRGELDLSHMEEVAAFLVENGLGEEEVRAVCTWLFLSLPDESREPAPSLPDLDECKGVRVLGPMERNRVSPEHFGRLLHLEQMGLIDGSQRELVLEYLRRVSSRSLEEGELDLVVERILAEARSRERSRRDPPGNLSVH
jgi:uncharacterized protein Smg (DUF494 family)